MEAMIGSSDTESSQSTTSQSSGTSTYDPTQSAQYQNLVSSADEFLGGAGPQSQQAGVDFLGQQLSGAYQGYQDAMSGGQSTDALRRAQMSNLDMAGTSADRAMQGIGVASQGTGTAASARRGIAEGVASADIYSQANAQNAQMGMDFEQSQLNRQLQATQGMASMTGNIISGMDATKGASSYQQELDKLYAYKNLISGNMGGTETSAQSGTSNTIGSSSTDSTSFGSNFTV
jgi:hypothetical protein